MIIPEGYIRKRSSTIPFGYELDDNTKGYFNPLLTLKSNLTNKIRLNIKVSEEIGIFELLSSQDIYFRNHVKFMNSEINVNIYEDLVLCKNDNNTALKFHHNNTNVFLDWNIVNERK